MERPVLEGVLNFRDLAEAAPGLQAGRIYRSARPCFATPADVAALRLRAPTLLDLRTPEEAEYALAAGGPFYAACLAGALDWRRQPLLDAAGFQRGLLRELGLRDRARAGLAMVRGGRRAAVGALVPALDQAGLLGLNRVLLEHGAENIAAALSVLAEPANHPLVFFCTAGKDRTGLIAALTLAVVGVDDQSIAADYARSHALYEDHADTVYGGQLMAFGLDPAVFLAAHPETMLETLAHLRSRYGGVDTYLDGAGFGPGDRARLAKALLSAR